MKLLPRWWRAHFLPIEMVVAVIGTLALVGWAECLSGIIEIDRVLSENRGALYGTVASIFGSLLGFTITATSIVLGFSSSERLRIVRESKHYPTLWKVFGATIRALGLATIVSLVALIFDRDAAPNHYISYFLVFAFLLSCFRISRTVWLLEKIVGLITRPTGDNREEGK